MARRRLQRAVGGPVAAREAMLARYRKLLARYEGLEGVESSPWARLVERLDAGRPVVVSGWQLPREVFTHRRSSSRYRLEVDGSLVTLSEG